MMRYGFVVLLGMMGVLATPDSVAWAKEVTAHQVAPRLESGALRALPTEKIKFLSAGRILANLTVELAMTPQDQEHGLMGRTKMPKDTGMLFVFPQTQISYFWMRDTLIPLDIIFVDQDGRIIKIHENAKPKDETVIPSDFPARAALEIPAGRAKKYGLNRGDLLLSDTLDNMIRAEGDELPEDPH